MIQYNHCQMWYNFTTLISYQTKIAFIYDGAAYLWRYPSNTTARHISNFRKLSASGEVSCMFYPLIDSARRNKWDYAKAFTDENGVFQVVEISRVDFLKLSKCNLITMVSSGYILLCGENRK